MADVGELDVFEAMSLGREAAKRARHAAGLCLLVFAAAVAVLVIDNGIKRAILEETQKARSILNEFKVVANGAQAAGETRTAAGDPVDSGNGVVHAAGAPAAAADDAGTGQPAQAGGPRRKAAGSRRDG